MTNFTLVRIGQFAVRHEHMRLWSGVSCAANLSPREAERGNLLLILSIPLKDASAENLADSLSEHISTVYYSYSPPAEKSKSEQPTLLEPVFEELIKQTNSWLSRTLPTYGRKWLEESDIFIGAIRGSELVFSTSGAIHPFLIQPRKMVDLVQATRSGGGYFNPFKAFSSVVSGKLEEDNRLVIVTDGVLDYLSLDRLRKIVTSQTAQEAAQTLTQLLRIPKTQLSLAGIVIEPLWEEIAKTTSQKRKQELYAEQNAVTAITASPPPPVRDYKQLAVKLLNAILNIIKKMALAAGKTAIEAVQKIYHYARCFKTPKRNIAPPRFGLKMRASRLQKTNAVLPVLQSLMKILSQWVKKAFHWFSGLPRLSQILFIVSAVFAALFLLSIVKNGGTVSRAEQERSYALLETAIQEKIKNAESALIYKDEQKTIEMLNESKDLLVALPKNSLERRKKYELTEQSINNLFNEIRLLKPISSPRLAAELLQIDPPRAKYALIPTAGKPFLFGFDGATIWSVESSSNPVLLRRGGIENASIRQAVDLEHFLVLVGSLGEVFSIEKDNQTIERLPDKISFSPKTISGYGDRLYLLDPAQNNILKTGNLPKELSSQKRWIVDGTNVQETVSFAVDGSVYVLLSNGNVLEMHRGSKTGWQTKIEPALSAPNQIWTNAASSYLYVFDPPTKRIAVLNKATGKVKIQYTSEKFQFPSQFSVNEQTKELFVLDGTKLFVVPMTHL